MTARVFKLALLDRLYRNAIYSVTIKYMMKHRLYISWQILGVGLDTGSSTHQHERGQNGGAGSAELGFNAH